VPSRERNSGLYWLRAGGIKERKERKSPCAGRSLRLVAWFSLRKPDIRFTKGGVRKEGDSSRQEGSHTLLREQYEPGVLEVAHASERHLTMAQEKNDDGT